MWLRKGNLNRETESLLIVAQNNAIRTNHIKTEREIRYNKTSNVGYVEIETKPSITLISKRSKLAQKMYKTRHDWVGQAILWELCKKFKSKFDHTNKWYMHNPKFVLENETHKLLRDFEIQTDYLISAYNNRQKKREFA